MTEPLPLLIDSSIEIAWDYLNRTGELGDAMVAGRFLSDTIELMVRRGERRRLMLANKAIAAYQQFRRAVRASGARVGVMALTCLRRNPSRERRLKSRFNQRSSS